MLQNTDVPALPSIHHYKHIIIHIQISKKSMKSIL